MSCPNKRTDILNSLSRLLLFFLFIALFMFYASFSRLYTHIPISSEYKQARFIIAAWERRKFSFSRWLYVTIDCHCFVQAYIEANWLIYKSEKWRNTFSLLRLFAMSITLNRLSNEINVDIYPTHVDDRICIRLENNVLIYWSNVIFLALLLLLLFRDKSFSVDKIITERRKKNPRNTIERTSTSLREEFKEMKEK